MRRIEKRLKVALVHDWLTGMRGGEKVLEVLCSLFPEADIYALFYFEGLISPVIEQHHIQASFLQRFPFAKRHYRSYLPLFPQAIESFKLENYDLVISTSHCVAKGVISNPEAVHLSYCFTPMRYIWDRRFDYFERQGWLKTLAVEPILHYLRTWDTASSGRVTRFVTISEFVRNRIRSYYHRDAVVIYPPVECDRFHLSGSKGDYYLMISAFAPYKKVDQAVLAFNKLGRRLMIVGKGQEEKKIRKLAGRNIEFLGWVDDKELPDLYAGCRALVFPGVEDFGLVPVEVQAAGRPVIAYGRGGVLETVVPYLDKAHPGSGLFFGEQTPQALIRAVEKFEEVEDHFEPKRIREHAMRFDKKRFIREFKTLVGNAMRHKRIG